MGIVNVLDDIRGQLYQIFCHNQQSRKGSLIIGHVCIGRDWKECCFMYDSLMISEASSIRYSATAYHMPWQGLINRVSGRPGQPEKASGQPE